MNFFGGPALPDPVYCERRCKFNPNGVCTKKTQTRIIDTVHCQFFQREVACDE